MLSEIDKLSAVSGFAGLLVKVWVNWTEILLPRIVQKPPGQLSTLLSELVGSAKASVVPVIVMSPTFSQVIEGFEVVAQAVDLPLLLLIELPLELPSSINENFFGE